MSTKHLDVTTQSIVVMRDSVDLQKRCQSLLKNSRNSGMLGVCLILATTQEGSLAIEDRYCNQLVPPRVQSLLRKAGCAGHYIGGDKSWNISALIHKPN